MVNKGYRRGFKLYIVRMIQAREWRILKETCTSKIMPNAAGPFAIARRQ
jgi:hypothetical protein